MDASTNRINSLLFKVDYLYSLQLFFHLLTGGGIAECALPFGQVRSLRMSGSCALDLCGIACGRLDLFYLVGFGGPW